MEFDTKKPEPKAVPTPAQQHADEIQHLRDKMAAAVKAVEAGQLLTAVEILQG